MNRCWLLLFCWWPTSTARRLRCPFWNRSTGSTTTVVIRMDSKRPTALSKLRPATTWATSRESTATSTRLASWRPSHTRPESDSKLLVITSPFQFRLPYPSKQLLQLGLALSPPERPQLPLVHEPLHLSRPALSLHQHQLPSSTNPVWPPSCPLQLLASQQQLLQFTERPSSNSNRPTKSTGPSADVDSVSLSKPQCSSLPKPRSLTTNCPSRWLAKASKRPINLLLYLLCSCIYVVKRPNNPALPKWQHCKMKTRLWWCSSTVINPPQQKNITLGQCSKSFVIYLFFRSGTAESRSLSLSPTCHLSPLHGSHSRCHYKSFIVDWIARRKMEDPSPSISTPTR